MAIVGDRIEQEIFIQAPPAVVFAFFTEAAEHPRWMGRRALLDPRPGGVYLCEVNDTHTVIGTFVEIDCPRRIVFTWGFAGSDAVPPGSSTVSVTLTAVGDGTRLHLLHDGLPHPTLSDHDKGWRGYTAQLAEVATAKRQR